MCARWVPVSGTGGAQIVRWEGPEYVRDMRSANEVAGQIFAAIEAGDAAMVASLDADDVIVLHDNDGGSSRPRSNTSGCSSGWFATPCRVSTGRCVDSR